MGDLLYNFGNDGDFFYLEGLFYCLDLLGLILVNFGMEGDCLLGGELFLMRFFIRYCFGYFYCLHYEAGIFYCRFYEPLLCKNYTVCFILMLLRAILMSLSFLVAIGANLMMVARIFYDFLYLSSNLCFFSIKSSVNGLLGIV